MKMGRVACAWELGKLLAVLIAIDSTETVACDLAIEGPTIAHRIVNDRAKFGDSNARRRIRIFGGAVPQCPAPARLRRQNLAKRG